MSEASQGICKRTGMAHLQQGRLGAALRWLGRCADARALDPAGQDLAARIAEHAALAPSTAASGVAPFEYPSISPCWHCSLCSSFELYCCMAVSYCRRWHWPLAAQRDSC